MLDANILMCGSEKRSDVKYSFYAMKESYIVPILSYFKDIIIHETVYHELEEECKELLKEYIGKNISIVSEDDLYAKDAIYTDIFTSEARN